MTDDRRDGIGASDAAAVMGISPWKSPIELWEEKTAEEVPEPRADDDAQHWGRELETVIGRRYTHNTGRRLRRPSGRRRVHPVYKWMWCHPDFEVLGEPGLVQAKTGRKRWDDEEAVAGEPKSALKIPLHYRLQGVHELAVTGRDWVDFAVLHWGTDFAIYRLERDERAIELLIEAEQRFWLEHVVPRVPPPVDDSEGWRRYLQAAHPKEQQAELVATAEISMEALRLLDAKESLKQLERQVEGHSNRIKQAMGDYAKLLGPGFTATWTRSRDGETTNWEAVAKAFRAIIEEEGYDDDGTFRLEGHEYDLDAIQSIHTMVVPGARRFLIKRKETGE